MNTIKRIINLIKNHNKISNLVYDELGKIEFEIQRKTKIKNKEEKWWREKAYSKPYSFDKNGNFTKYGVMEFDISVLKSKRKPLEQLQKLIMRGGE